MRSKRLLYSALIILCILLQSPLAISSADQANVEHQANQGYLDLSDWNPDIDGVIKLDGQWELYWKKLYTPDSFIDENNISNPVYIHQPRAWNKMMIEDEQLPGDGYGTYRLRISNLEDRFYGIKIPRIFTAYKLWINNDLLAFAGKVGSSKSDMIPQYLPQIAYFKPVDNQVDIVIQVSNFRHRSGGILDSIRFGDSKQITDIRNRAIAFDLFLFGSLLIIGFYHIILYLFRLKDRTNLYFGIYALLISARTLLVGEIFLIYLIPDFSWELAHKIQTIAFYMGVPLVVLFMKSTFPLDVSKRFTKISVIIGAAFSTLVLLTPARIFNLVNPLYQLVTLIVISYLLYIVVAVIVRRRVNSLIIGFGLLVIIIFSLNDIIFLSIWMADSEHTFLRSIISRGNLASYGLLIFVFIQSIVLAKKFSKSFATVEHLSDELKTINLSLEEKVNERTKDLELSRAAMYKAYQTATESEQALADFTQNISHDLRAPIAAIKGYVNGILDGIIKEDQKEKYLIRSKERIDQMTNMVQDLLDLSMLQTKQTAFSFQSISIFDFVNRISDEYSLDMASSHVDFKINKPFIRRIANQSESIEVLSDETISRLELSIDIEKIERVFANLFSNSIKYCLVQPKIRLDFELTDDLKELIIMVTDNGIGIPEDDLLHIFDRSYKTSSNQMVDGSNTSNGLGLAIVKEILASHGGDIWVSSELGSGSCFCFNLPICNSENSEIEII